MSDLIKLFWAFFKIGGLTFGGGYSMLPMLKRETVESNEWISENELLDYYAVGQATPGAIAINTAVFIGYKKKGIMGAMATTLGVVSPSFIIIMSIASVIDIFSDMDVVQYAFSGIRVVVAALILNSLIDIWKNSIIDKFGIVIFITAFTCGAIVGISPVYIVLSAAIIGIIKDYKRGSK